MNFNLNKAALTCSLLLANTVKPKLNKRFNVKLVNC